MSCISSAPRNAACRVFAEIRDSGVSVVALAAGRTHGHTPKHYNREVRGSPARCLAVRADNGPLAANRTLRPGVHPASGQDAPRAGTANPHRVLPAGDIVVDPMCGIGTTLVEAAALGRRCIGVELEERWVTVTRANLAWHYRRDSDACAGVRIGATRVRWRRSSVASAAERTCRALATLLPVTPASSTSAAWLRGRATLRRSHSQLRE